MIILEYGKVTLASTSKPSTVSGFGSVKLSTVSGFGSVKPSTVSGFGSVKPSAVSGFETTTSFPTTSPTGNALVFSRKF